MTRALNPETLEELAEAVRSTPRLLAVGAGTKPRLSAVDVARISTLRLNGVIEYEPTEFTFTALAGTPVRDLAAILAERGQHLPFDPLQLDAGATLGGTVASGLSGPGRFRFGGVRDFILGVRFVDGSGRLLRLGGKVVKNAAGFDLPKFFVGSLGRFGVLAEITFKVFPKPAATLTLRLAADDMMAAARLLMEAARTRWEPVAIDIPPGGGGVHLRLAGPATALEAISQEILARWPGAVLDAENAEQFWSDLGEFRWVHTDGLLAKVALAPAQLAAFERSIRALGDVRTHISGGGNVAFVSLPASVGSGALNEALRALALPGLLLRGAGPLRLGLRRPDQISAAVKDALDPQNRFPDLET